MKKISTLLLLAILISLSTTAQIAKGSILLGGQITYLNSNYKYNTTQPGQKDKIANLGVAAGKAIKDNLVVGLDAGYYSSKSSNSNPDNYSKTNQYKAGVFIRQYKKLAKNFYFFAEIEAAYFRSDQKSTDSTGTTYITYIISGGQLALTPGISYNLFKKLQLEIVLPNMLGVNYSVYNSVTQTSGYKHKFFNFTTNLSASSFNSLGVGLRLIL